jgi:hypothetical protein
MICRLVKIIVENDRRNSIAMGWTNCLTRCLIATIIVVGGDLAEAVSQDPCIDALPPELIGVLKRDYPRWVIAHEPDWREDQLLYGEQIRKNICPWAAKVDFYGDGRLVYAIVIEKKSKGSMDKREGKLLLAQAEQDKRWILFTLEDDIFPLPVIVGSAGTYESVGEVKTIKSKGEVLVLYSQSAAIVYAWTGGKIDSTHIRD